MLLIVAPANALFDQTGATILTEAMLPAFHRGNYAGGFSAGVDRIIAEIGPES